MSRGLDGVVLRSCTVLSGLSLFLRELRRLFNHMEVCVGSKFPGCGTKAVGGLFFLRFVCPCFVTPERWELVKRTVYSCLLLLCLLLQAVTLYVTEGGITNAERRKIILVSKVFQMLSNQLLFGGKEADMVPLNDLFISTHLEKMKSFQALLAVCCDSEIW